MYASRSAVRKCRRRRQRQKESVKSRFAIAKLTRTSFFTAEREEYTKL
jgi:hypothetical protein